MAKKKAAPAKGQKETKEAVMGGEGGGAGNGTAPAPAPAAEAKEQAPKGKASEKPDGLPKQAIAEAFRIHPMDRLYVTSDGQLFGDKKHAENHARSLESKVISEVDRNTYGK